MVVGGNPNALVLASLGLMALIVGVLLATGFAQDAALEAAHIERLPPLTRAAFDASKVGQEALVEGLLSVQNSALSHDFVAYVREEYRHGGRNFSWVEVERHTPPLRIDLADGTIVLANASYVPKYPPHTWEAPGRQNWLGLTSEGARRERGFRAGDAVLVVGRLASGREGPALRAEWIMPGTRAGYLNAQRRLAAVLPWFGSLLALSGVGLIVVGVRRRKVVVRPAPPARTVKRRRGQQVGG